MWTQHNPRVPLGVIAMISKGSFWQISNILIKIVFRAFPYLNPSTVHIVLNYHWEHTLIKVTRKIKLVHEIGLVSDHLVTNQESLELFLYTFKPMCRTTFETPWGKVQNLLGMKLKTDVTLLFLSAVNNIYILFLFHRCGLWNKLNQRIFVMSVIRLPVQLKWISKKLSWEMIVCANVFVVNRLQSENKRPITSQI